MASLTDYSNVHDTVFGILSEKGFQCWYEEEQDLYWAEKDGWDFSSPSPCGLLGLIAIFEYRNPSESKSYWWRSDREPRTKNLPLKPNPYTPVWQKNF